MHVYATFYDIFLSKAHIMTSRNMMDRFVTKRPHPDKGTDDGPSAPQVTKPRLGLSVVSEAKTF